MHERVQRVHHPLIAQPRIELKRWRKTAGTARRTVRIQNVEDRLSVLSRGRWIRKKRGIIGDQERGIGLLTAVPGRTALSREAVGEHPDDRSLHPANAVVRSIGVEAYIPQDARIEEGDLHILPVFLVYRPVPLQAVVKEFRLPAELVIGQIIGRVRQRRAVLWHTAGVRKIAGKAAVEGAGTEAL